METCSYCYENPVFESNYSCAECRFECYDCKKIHPYEFGGAPCLACDSCHLNHDETKGDCLNG